MALNRVQVIFRSISVEPGMLLFFTGFAIYSTTSFSALFYKICTLNYQNASVDCNNLDGLDDVQDAVELDTSTYLTYITAAIAIPACISNLVLSAWADKHGRKTNMFISIIGTSCVMLLFTCSMTYLDSPLYILPIGGIFVGCTGYISLFAGSSFQYLVDTVVDEDMLTIRLTIAAACWSLGYVFGGFIASALLEVMSFQYTFVISQGFLLVAALYCWAMLEQKSPLEWRNTSSTEKLNPTETELKQPAKSDASFLTLCRDIIHTLTRKREGHYRLYIWLLLLAYFPYVTVDQGVDSITQLFLKERPLIFDPGMIADYWSATSLVQMTGSISSSIILKKLKFSDSSIVLMSMISAIAKLIVISIAKSKLLVYISVVAGIFSVVGYPAMEAILAGLTGPDEFGKVFAGMGVVANLAPLFANLVYNNIYNATLHIWNGVGFIFVAALVTIAWLAFAWIHVDYKKHLKKAGKEETTDSNPTSLVLRF